MTTTASGTASTTWTTRSWRRSTTTTSTAMCRAPRPSRSSSPASTCPASTAAAGSTPATMTFASSRRPTRSTGWRSRGSCSTPPSTTPRLTKPRTSSKSTGPTGSPTSSSRSSTACSRSSAATTIEHGVLTIVGGYNSLGRLYRGIQDASLHQYTFLGDAAGMTDNLVFHDAGGSAMRVLAEAAVSGSQAEPGIDHLPPLGSQGSADDRWVFTEDNAQSELGVAGGLAAAPRALTGFNDPLAKDCLRIARELWKGAKAPDASVFRLEAAIELYQTTGEREYADVILGLGDQIVARVDHIGWLGARSLPLLNDDAFTAKIKGALRLYRARIDTLEKETPYGVQQYFLHAGAPEIFPTIYMLHAVDFILGCHPGPNTASFVSGVGAKSLIPAYGTNRADWSYIPGGIASGTAIIRPDFPELLDWPFLWQQGEYCLGYPTSDYVFQILAADHLLNQ